MNGPCSFYDIIMINTQFTTFNVIKHLTYFFVKSNKITHSKTRENRLGNNVTILIN